MGTLRSGLDELRGQDRSCASDEELGEDLVRIDGDLDPESGQTLIAALRSVQDAWARTVCRTLELPPSAWPTR